MKTTYKLTGWESGRNGGLPWQGRGGQWADDYFGPDNPECDSVEELLAVIVSLRAAFDYTGVIFGYHVYEDGELYITEYLDSRLGNDLEAAEAALEEDE